MTTSRATYASLVASMLLATLASPFIAGAQAVSDGCGTGLNGTYPDGCSAPATTAASLAATAASPSDYAYQRQGVFGCNMNGSYSMSVGALSAVGGVYVPVNDAAVTLNTGYLVYKECVLRGVVNRERENATANYQKSGLSRFLSGRDGQPYFSQRLTTEKRLEYDRTVLLSLENGSLDALNPTIRSSVQRAIAQGYMRARNQATKAFECSYTGDLTAVLKGTPQGSYWAALGAMTDPACSPYSAYLLANTYVEEIAADSVRSLETQLGWYGGVYPKDEIDARGERVVLTPGSIISSNALQLLQTGYRQLENANDIDQMVGALFSGVTSHLLNDSKGLVGLTQKNSGVSYLDKVVSESQAGLRTSALNAAIQILGATKQVELQYKQLMEAIATVLSDTIGTLRARENACWTLIVDKVCASAPNANKECPTKGTCTTVTNPDGTTSQSCTTGVTLKVATSTAYSQAVISAQVQPLASSTITNIQDATRALSLIDQLIAAVTSSNSTDAQRVALQQLDSLVSQRALHTQYDVVAAQGAKQDVTTRMGNVVTDTTTAWADSTDTSVGWCNVNNAAVIQKWIDAWKK